MPHLLLFLLLARGWARAAGLPAYEMRSAGFDGGGWVTGIEAHAASGIVYARTDVGGAYRSDDGAASWTWLSGFMERGDVWGTQGLAADPSDASGLTVLIGVGGGAVTADTGIYKSTTGGTGAGNWRQVLASASFVGNGDLRQSYPAIAYDAGRPHRVWALPQQGVYLSVDGGDSFAPLPAFVAATGYNASDASKYGMSLVALTGAPASSPLAGHVVVAGKGFGLAFSPDDGATWSRLAPPALPFNVTQAHRFLRLANGSGWLAFTDGSNHQQLWALTGATDWSEPASWTWAKLSPGASQTRYGLVDLPDGPDGPLVMCSDDSPLYVSTNGGAGWAVRNATVTANKPVWWTDFSGHQLLSWGRNGLVVSSRTARPGRWITATGFGVAVSDDGGDTWAWSSAGIAEVCMFACKSHPARANWTFCGAEDLTGFIVTEGGAAAIAAFPREPAYWATDFGKGAAWHDLSAASTGGLSFAGDAQMDGSMGQWITWPAPADPRADLSFIAIRNATGALNNVSIQLTGLYQSPDDAADLLLTGGWGWFGPWNDTIPPYKYSGGVVRSRDGGATWAHVAQQPPAGFVGNTWTDFGQIAGDGGDADTRWWGVCNMYVYLSRDRGETWAQIPFVDAPLLPWGLQYALAPDAKGGAGHEWLLAAVGNGTALRRTANFGASWAVVGNFTLPSDTAGYPYPHIASHRSGRLAFVAVAPGSTAPHVFASLDDGATFLPVDDAARGEYLAPHVSGLEWDAVDPTVLYISTGGRSVSIVKFAQ